MLCIFTVFFADTYLFAVESAKYYDRNFLHFMKSVVKINDKAYFSNSF